MLRVRLSHLDGDKRPHQRPTRAHALRQRRPKPTPRPGIPQDTGSGTGQRTQTGRAVATGHPPRGQATRPGESTAQRPSQRSDPTPGSATRRSGSAGPAKDKERQRRPRQESTAQRPPRQRHESKRSVGPAAQATPQRQRPGSATTTPPKRKRNTPGSATRRRRDRTRDRVPG